MINVSFKLIDSDVESVVCLCCRSKSTIYWKFSHKGSEKEYEPRVYCVKCMPEDNVTAHQQWLEFHMNNYCIKEERRQSPGKIDVCDATSMREKGATFLQIANKFGTSKQAVHQLLKSRKET